MKRIRIHFWGKLIIVAGLFFGENAQGTFSFKQQYDICYDTGFLPKTNKYSLPKGFGFLQDLHESVSFNGINRISDINFRKTVNRNIVSWPKKIELQNMAIEDLRLLYTLISFVSLKYIWCQGVNHRITKLPKRLGSIWLSLSNSLGLKTVSTYSNIIMFNWKFNAGIDPKCSNIEMGKIEPIYSFTGSSDEYFFTIPMVVIEKFGGNIIKCHDEIQKYSIQTLPSRVLINFLREMKKNLAQMRMVLKQVNTNTCRVDYFFNKIRPFLFGFNDVNLYPYGLNLGNDNFVKYSGGSGAQSPIYHFLDIVLGVYHKKSSMDEFNKFLEAMSLSHKKYLLKLKKKNSLRKIIFYYKERPEVASAFNELIDQFYALRKTHASIVRTHVTSKTKKNKHEEMGTGGSVPQIFVEDVCKSTIETKIHSKM